MAGAMKEVLDNFRAIRGVDLAAVIGDDGLVIESVARPGVDVDAIAAVASHGLMLAEAMGRQIERGGALQTIVEYEDGVMLLESLGEEGMMLVMSREPADLGRIRFAAKQHKAGLAEALAAV